MKHNNPPTQDDEIDFLKFLSLFWKKKLFVLSFSFLFFVLGFLYYNIIFFSNKWIKSSEFEAETIFYLKKAPDYLFIKYGDFINLKDPLKDGLAVQFNKEFQMNMLGENVLNNFHNQYQKNDTLKLNFNKKNFYIESVKDHKGIVNDGQYKLIHDKRFDPRKFLYDYVFFVKSETEKYLKKILSENINHKIIIYNYNLKIAEKINLEDHISKQISILTDDNSSLYFKGTKVLSLDIMYYTNLLKEVEQLRLDYNPFLKEPEILDFKSLKNIKHPVYYALSGFILGFALSIIIIFFKITSSNN